MTLVFLKSTRTACTYYTCGRVGVCTVRVGFEISTVIVSQRHTYFYRVRCSGVVGVVVFINSTRTACTYYTCARARGTRGVLCFYLHLPTFSPLFVFCSIRAQSYNIFPFNPNFSPTRCAPKSGRKA